MPNQHTGLNDAPGLQAFALSGNSGELFKMKTFFSILGTFQAILSSSLSATNGSPGINTALSLLLLSPASLCLNSLNKGIETSSALALHKLFLQVASSANSQSNLIISNRERTAVIRLPEWIQRL